jgi:hypothetical protein
MRLPRSETSIGWRPVRCACQKVPGRFAIPVIAAAQCSEGRKKCGIGFLTVAGNGAQPARSVEVVDGCSIS